MPKTETATGPVLVRTSKTCFINNNRYYPGDTLVYRGGELPDYLTPVESAPADDDDDQVSDALS